MYADLMFLNRLEDQATLPEPEIAESFLGPEVWVGGQQPSTPSNAPDFVGNSSLNLPLPP